MGGQQRSPVHVRVWLDTEEGLYLGEGRVRLLELIGSTGSISKAANALHMSYRQAWQHVQDMNAGTGEPLVRKVQGGVGGGGAELTEAGKRGITIFREMRQRIEQYATELAAAKTYHDVLYKKATGRRAPSQQHQATRFKTDSPKT